MKKYFGLLLLIELISNSCSNNQKSTKQILLRDTKNAESVFYKKDFDSLMRANKNIELDYYEELLNDKSFVFVLDHSHFYLKDVIAFLSKMDFNSIQAEICICSMQNLNVNDYILLCNLYLSLYEKYKITDQILEDAISPDFLKKRIIINNYENPKVVALLKAITDNKRIINQDFKKYIPRILSGKAKEELQSFDDGNK